MVVGSLFKSIVSSKLDFFGKSNTVRKLMHPFTLFMEGLLFDYGCLVPGTFGSSLDI